MNGFIQYTIQGFLNHLHSLCKQLTKSNMHPSNICVQICICSNGNNPPFATLKKLGKLLYVPLYQTHQESTWGVCWKLFKLYVWSSDYSFKRSIYHHHITTKYFFYTHLQGMYPKMLKRCLLQFILLQLHS